MKDTRLRASLHPDHEASSATPPLHPAPRTVAVRHAPGRTLENLLENTNCARGETYTNQHLGDL